MQLRIDGRDARPTVADADDARLMRHRRQRAIEETAAITEPVTGRIEADDGSDDDIRPAGVRLGGDGNVPDTARKRLARLPKVRAAVQKSATVAAA